MSSVRVQCPNPACRAEFSLAPVEAARFRRCPECGTQLSGVEVRPNRELAVTQTEFPTPRSGLFVGGIFAGRYRIDELLGRGGMGTVYRAQDLQLDRPVALKVPLLAGGEDTEYLRRFQREARAAARLHHPGICPLHDVNVHDGQPYLTMAYLKGITLADYLEKHPRPFEPVKAVRLVRMVARSLQVAHEAGIIHRDLKPANIMISREGRPIVMDFGLARRHDPNESFHTAAGQVMGTPAYMPLEQFRGEVHLIGPPCDIYSLGVILFQLLVGRVPYEGSSYSVLARLMSPDPPPAPWTLRPGLDEALGVICLKAMAKRIEDRYPSMAAFAAALDRWLTGTAREAPRPRTRAGPQPASSAGEAPPSPPPGPPPPPVPLPPSPAWVAPTQPLDEPALASPRRKSAGTWLVQTLVALLPLLGFCAYVATDKGTVMITGADARTEVRLDGRKLAPAELGQPVPVHAGEHELLVLRDDIRTRTELFQVARGQVIRIDLNSAGTPPGPIVAAAATPAPSSVRDADPTEPKPKPEPVVLPAPTAPPVPPPPAPPRTIASPVTGMTLLCIDPGTFTMGSDAGNDDERPPHAVRVSRPFYLGQHEVTQAEYEQVTGLKPSHFKDRPEHPVEQVSWLDAVTFCNKLSEQEGLPAYYQVSDTTVTIAAGIGYRLPTEAEWEYACRAGSTAAYGFGDEESRLPDHAWYLANSSPDGESMTQPVGRKRPNAWGLYDLHGNVWEWCWDGYDPHYYEHAPMNDPTGPEEAPTRVLRGGGWLSDAWSLRSSLRSSGAPAYRRYFVGFRVARSP